jgi:DNA-binding CsgD family transcriptional regulator
MNAAPPTTLSQRKRRLSARERAVLQLLAEGYTNHETAERLGITYDTARTHVRNVGKKLRTRNRPHAVGVGIACGEIAPPPIP